jgi:CyaY protein
MMDVISERDFEHAADEALHALERALSELYEVEADLESGILTIEFPDGDKFVINSHRAARQIWMAAERSAWHFDYDRATSRWIAQKTSDELRSTLETALRRKLKKAVTL